MQELLEEKKSIFKEIWMYGELCPSVLYSFCQTVIDSSPYFGSQIVGWMKVVPENNNISTKTRFYIQF